VLGTSRHDLSRGGLFGSMVTLKPFLIMSCTHGRSASSCEYTMPLNAPAYAQADTCTLSGTAGEEASNLP
jgi:hypothetical protein